MLARSLAKLERRRKNPEENQVGFTLIELLVVVIIIGILAAIAIPVFLNQRQSAWQASVGSDLKNAAIVVETHATKNNGSYAGFADAGTVIEAGTPGTTGIKFSEGNSLVVTVDGTTGYTIVGGNANVTGSQTYDSKIGGLQKFDSAGTAP